VKLLTDKQINRQVKRILLGQNSPMHRASNYGLSLYTLDLVNRAFQSDSTVRLVRQIDITLRISPWLFLIVWSPWRLLCRSVAIFSRTVRQSPTFYANL